MESKVDFDQHHHHHEEAADFITRPLYSLASSPIKKRRSPLKIKKRLAPKNPSNLKSNAKRVISDECGKTGSCKKKRTKIEDLYDNDEAKFSVMERAEELLANVADGFPSFVKCMLPSNVTHGFWLILPTIFCKLHLPMHDTTLILEDEWGMKYEANYLVERHGLSAGWRGFSQSHRLIKGDILVFHLIRPCTLKVHIVRVYGLDEVDAALCLMNLVAPAKRKCSDKNIKPRKKAKKYVKSLLLDIPQKNIQKNCPAVHYSSHGLVADPSKTNSVGSGSEVSEGSRISEHPAIESSCSQNPISSVLQIGDVT
ncbi:B3 domain-containing protein Os06g0194400-like isoform X2 [Actinidia eriantha]|uniref:B3 domain-containing protein Os06g0194400-like isoform X2 n=1 Tax=Actinidia eriantha TaxID=165200 RepID=UPI0025866FB6|nr:B3 domain-containing protein Os06g0194400-like isoform X2 [Actinidia eriantha]